MPASPGRFGSLGRVLGDGEDPLRWGLPIGRVAGIRLRVHWVFVLYVLSQVIFTLPRHQAGVVFVLPLMASLFVLVLLHEFGHCVACRRAGGEADEIVMWPLGGLAFCRPPNDWRAELRTALGGPAVNLALLPVFGGGLYAATGAWSAVLPNPFDLGGAILDLETAYGSMPWWLIALWSLHGANLVLLGFNLLVPMDPLDAGRVVRCLVWARAGRQRSLWVGAHVGLATGAGLVLLGLVLGDGKALLAVGLFGCLVCWMERRRLQFLAGAEPGLDVPVGPVVAADPGEDDADAGREEVDRILDKIARTGMKSLSAREKRVLKRATERSRDSEGSGPETDQ